MKNWGSKEIHPELMTTLGADAYRRSQIKIWIQKFRNGDLSCKDPLRTKRPRVTLDRNLRHFFKSILLSVPGQLRSTS
jgi:hypothetical protein